MKITFTIPDIGRCGGTKAVFEFANCLTEKGHQVFIVYPLFFWYPRGCGIYNLKNFKIRAEQTIGRLLHAFSPAWFNLKAKLIRVPTLAEKYIPDADIVVATAWPTAYSVKKYGPKKGKKFYLAQHYETWDGPEKLVKESYKLGLKIIVNSTWLKNVLEEKVGVKAENLIFHAPDLKQFYPDPARKRGDKLRILIPHRKEQWKGTRDGIEAFKIAAQKYPNIQLVLFSLGWGRQGVPDFAEFHQDPPQSKLREIYTSCDILLFPSWHEGFGMPPLEAMACKLAVVCTNVGAVPDYAIPGKTAIVCPARSPQLLAEGLIKLIENRELLNQIAEAGYNHIIKNFSWERSADLLEKFLEKICH